MKISSKWTGILTTSQQVTLVLRTATGTYGVSLLSQVKECLNEILLIFPFGEKLGEDNEKFEEE